MTELSDLHVAQSPLFVGAAAAYPYTDALASKFTLRSRFDDPYVLYQTRGDKILLPREVCPPAPDDRRALGVKVDLTSAIVPRDAEQARIIEESWELLQAGESFILEAGTGTGKTVFATELIARVGRKALFIAPKDDLIDNAVDAFKDFLGLKESEIGCIKAERFDVHHKKVVVASLKSLAMKTYPGWLRDEFGFVIWDEMHRVAAETFARTAMLFSAKLRLGLSATPSRADGKELLAFANLGPVRVRSQRVMMIPVVGTYESPWKVPKRYDGRPIPHKAGKCGHIINMLVNDKARNALLASKIVTCAKRGRNIVVFSDRIEHLKDLAQMARVGGVDPKDIVLYISGLKKEAREKAKVKPLIFATYGMMSEGTDIPWLDCCIFGTPRSNIQQSVGRILREYPGKPKPVVIDVIDWSSSVFRAFALNRKKYYDSIGAEVQNF